MKMKMLFIAGSVFLLLVGSTATFAQETVNPWRKSNVQNRQDIRQSRPGGGPNLEENLLKRKENIATRQAIRDERKTERAALREEFQTKLQTLKDEKKKLVVERVDRRLAAINKNQTDRMSKRLNRMTEIAGRIQERITAIAAQGQDTTAVQTALDGANNTMASSKTAVADQAAKEYVITITDEAALKNAVGTIRSQLQSDLVAVHKTVAAAKQALVSAHKALLSIRPKADETVSVTISP